MMMALWRGLLEVLRLLLWCWGFVRADGEGREGIKKINSRISKAYNVLSALLSWDPDIYFSIFSKLLK